MYDLIVIGAGAMGSAAAYHAAKAGRHVLLLEQYGIDHQRGSSYGYSRIIRYAYDHPVYVGLAKAAFAAWRDFEAESGETIYVRTGGIDFSPPGEPLFAKMVACLAEMNIPHELINADELRRRFPQFQPDEDMIALYQADAGVLRASRSVQAHVRLARERGAVVRDNTPVTAITPVSGGVEVRTPDETYSADKLIITSGAWMRRMVLPLGIDLPLQPIAPQENYFNPLTPEQFGTDRFPVWIAHLQAQYGQILYGLPSIDGSGVKIGLHTGAPIDPASHDRTPDDAVSDSMLQFARRYIPQAAGSLKQARVCLYTMTPDEHFIIDQHPDYPQIILGSCCSGHGFKFSSLIGSILSDLALKGKSAYDLSLFRLSRFEGIRS